MARPIVPISVLNNTDRPYKVYTFKFTQDSTSNPTVVVHENTIGNIVWTRTGAGLYRGTLIGAFPLAKTYFYTLDSSISTTLNTLNLEFFTLNPTQDYVTISVSDGMGGGQDGELNNVSFEIRVYP